MLPLTCLGELTLQMSAVIGLKGRGGDARKEMSETMSQAPFCRTNRGHDREQKDVVGDLLARLQQGCSTVGSSAALNIGAAFRKQSWTYL